VVLEKIENRREFSSREVNSIEFTSGARTKDRVAEKYSK
jgi:hypothetical protein